MAKKQAIGIQENMITTEHGFRQDKRTTAEVETSRLPNNLKPFRSKKQKEEARAEAFIPTVGKFKGTHISYVPRQVRG